MAPPSWPKHLPMAPLLSTITLNSSILHEKFWEDTNTQNKEESITTMGIKTVRDLNDLKCALWLNHISFIKLDNMLETVIERKVKELMDPIFFYVLPSKWQCPPSWQSDHLHLSALGLDTCVLCSNKNLTLDFERSFFNARFHYNFVFLALPWGRASAVLLSWEEM